MYLRSTDPPWSVSLHIIEDHHPFHTDTPSHLYQMLAQAASAQAAEKAVILDFNKQLAGQISAFKAAHSGVCLVSFTLVLTQRDTRMP